MRAHIHRQPARRTLHRHFPETVQATHLHTHTRRRARAHTHTQVWLPVAELSSSLFGTHAVRCSVRTRTRCERTNVRGHFCTSAFHHARVRARRCTRSTSRGTAAGTRRSSATPSSAGAAQPVAARRAALHPRCTVLQSARCTVLQLAQGRAATWACAVRRIPLQGARVCGARPCARPRGMGRCFMRRATRRAGGRSARLCVCLGCLQQHEQR
jgi:hypothetical protein